MKVHPAAEALPMMGAEELKELAADIKENGLLHPIITDSTGELLIDGRNRVKGCKIAGVKLKFQKLKRGQDLVAYIVSANLERRNMSKGQRAMVLAMIYPEPERGGRGKKSKARNLLETSGFSRQLLDNARAVLRYDRVKAELVRDGYTTLDCALNIVKGNRLSSGTTKAGKRNEQEPKVSRDLNDLDSGREGSEREPFKQILVHFYSFKGMHEFSKLIDQPFSEEATSIKYPRVSGVVGRTLEGHARVPPRRSDAAKDDQSQIHGTCRCGIILEARRTNDHREDEIHRLSRAGARACRPPEVDR